MLDIIKKQKQEIKSKIEQLKTALEENQIAFYNLPDYEQKKYFKETPAEKRIMRTWEKQREEIKHLEQLALIYKNNYRAELLKIVIPAFIAILKKYDGKKAGDKTRAKMSDELNAAVGCRTCFNRIWDKECTLVEITELSQDWVCGEKFDFYISHDNAFINDENIINGKITADDIKCEKPEYIDNPEERLTQIKAAWETVQQEKEKYMATVNAYNALIVDGMDRG